MAQSVRLHPALTPLPPASAIVIAMTISVLGGCGPSLVVLDELAREPPPWECPGRRIFRRRRTQRFAVKPRR